MSERETDPRTPVGFAARLGRAIVWLRFFVVAAWIAGLVLAIGNLPSAFEGESAGLESLLPSSSKALEVEANAVQTFGFPLISRTIVVAEKPGGFSPQEGTAALRYIAGVDTTGKSLRAVPYSSGPGPPRAADLGTTMLVYLYTKPSAEVKAVALGEEFAAGLKRASGAETTKLTGAVPASVAETEISEEHLLWVEIATVVLVVGILALYFRSLGVPLLCVAAVAVAYFVSDRVLGVTAERFELAIPEEVEPVIIALLFGVVTDYLVFFVAGFRHRLAAGASPTQAASEATGELVPVICTAALMIAGATMALSLSGVAFLSAFGPAMAISVLVGAAVSLTLIPACLAIFGRAILWPHRVVPAEGEDGSDQVATGKRGQIVGFAARHPILVAGACIVALLVGASGLRQLELGNPIIRGLPDTSTVKQGYNEAAAAFGPGVLGPTMLVVEGQGVGEDLGVLTDLQSRIEAEPGISGVLGPAQQPVAEPKGPFLAPDGSAARYALVLDADPDGPVAAETLERLEARLPTLLAASGLAHAGTGITGDTTIGSELTEDTWHAGLKVAPVALAVLLLLLWVLLRSRAAPLYLVGSSLLVVAAALGLTVYVFQGLIGYNEIAFFVPVATAILLLALGADYNVFLVNRIWREAREEDLRTAIGTAGSRASSAITVAGLTLALSFAAVWLIPIVAFRELAFALFVGLVLDTWIARPLLIPALVSLFGDDDED